jgi:hypothetical protein
MGSACERLLGWLEFLQRQPGPRPIERD